MKINHKTLSTEEKLILYNKLYSECNFNNIDSTISFYKQVRELYSTEYKQTLPEINKICIEKGYLNEKGFSKSLGACHYIWDIEKEVMKNKYGILWPSTQDLNPFTKYD